MSNYRAFLRQLPNFGIHSTLRTKLGMDADLSTYELLSTGEGFFEFLYKAATYKPTWQFLISSGFLSPPQPHSHNSRFTIEIVHVYSGSELLGRFKVERRRSGDKIMLTNERVDKSLQRGVWKAAGSADKALAAMKKFFSPKSRQEQVERAETQARLELSKLRSNLSGTANSAEEDLFPKMREFVWNNLPMFENFLTTTQCAHMLEAATERRKAYKEFQKMEHNVGNALVIVLEGEYIVRYPKPNDAPEIISPDQIQDRYKRGLGILKLTDPGAFVRGAGVRVSKDVFIVEEATNEQAD